MKGVVSRRRHSGRRKGIQTRSSPRVFAVHKTETTDGRFHEVAWAADGDLNAAYRRGNIRRFRFWPLAKHFAKGKGKTLGVKPTID